MAKKFPRSSGILLHPTSLPTRFGIGYFGPAAYYFADFLARAGQSLWQVLPLCPTGYGDSPYQSFSAFAGNPLLISLELLADEGWLSLSEFDVFEGLPADRVDYQRVNQLKLPLLRKTYQKFSSRKNESFCEFKDAQKHWLDDFALFMALKDAHGGVAWTHWERELVRRDAAALKRAAEQFSEEIESHKFAQYVFFRQWKHPQSTAAGPKLRERRSSRRLRARWETFPSSRKISE